MNSFFTTHVMFCAWVWEEIDLYIIVNTFLNETQAVLPHHNRVNYSLTDKEFAFKVFSLVDETCLCISDRKSVV